MKILFGYTLLAFLILFNLVGLNSGVRSVIPSNNLDPEPKPTFIEDVPEDQFHVEGTTLYGGSGKKAGRIFNSNFVRTIPDTVYHRCFQYNVLGTDLKFVFERDAYRRLANVFKLNGNKLPVKGHHYVATYVATINGLQFLVHKTVSGYIVGASAPPNQVPITEVTNKRPRIEPEEPGSSHKIERPRIEPEEPGSSHTIKRLRIEPEEPGPSHKTRRSRIVPPPTQI